MIFKGKLFLVTLFFIFPIFASAQDELKERDKHKNSRASRFP